MNDKKQLILNAQLTALLNRLKEGKPLTTAQIQFVEEHAAAPETAEQVDTEEYAKSASDLANRLGVSRQVVSYHRTRDGAPKTFNVAQWTTYLQACGKNPVTSKLAPGAGGKSSETNSTAAHMMWLDQSNSLGNCVRAVLENSGVKATSKQRDKITLGLWWLLTIVGDRSLKHHGCERLILSLDSAKDGVDYEDEIPEAIQALAARVAKNSPPVNAGND